MKKYQMEDVIPDRIHTYDCSAATRRGVFHVGGKKIPCGDDYVIAGQMYAEVYVPEQICHPYPVVLIHGNGQTGVSFLQTLTGDAGWVNDFLEAGYVVYVVDQPERGRSVCHPDMFGKRVAWPALATAALFSEKDSYPLAWKHTRWPGEGTGGDEIYDDFYRMQVDSLADQKTVQELMTEAGVELLKKTGPAILIGHSQGGPLIWPIADRLQDHVKALIAIEPSGPPFFNISTGELYADAEGKPTNYGLCQVPLHFEPETAGAQELKLEASKAPAEDKKAGYLQQNPARKLCNLKNIPTCIYTSEASYHTEFDYLTARFLNQAGVTADYIELGRSAEECTVLSGKSGQVGDFGQEDVHGNGHMMMCEENSHETAEVLLRWLEAQQLDK